MITAHPIDTGAASQWALVGRPSRVLRYRDTNEVAFFIQRSWMRGRPWLRFSARVEPSRDDRWYVTAFKTRYEALLGETKKR